MGWAIGAGLALALLLLIAIANFLLIAARIFFDRIDAKFLLLAFASLGSGQTLLFFAAARAGLFSAPTFEIFWLISMCIAISSLVAVLIFGGTSRTVDRN
ncbi:MAG: hypothetical protein ACK553_03860 [Planctomycetota bacterium]|jgi:hypothetical protein